MVTDIKLLYLAYYFPPLGGAGSQRSLKFVKYLPEFGIRPVVLGGLNDGKDRWAQLDVELEKEIDGVTVVRRVNLYEKPFGGRLQRLARDWLAIGSQLGGRWLKAVQTDGGELCATERPNVILATMSPFETAAGAANLSRRFGIPWVADLRDPWALDEWQVHPSGFHRMLCRNEMAKNLRSATLIIMNTPEAAKRCRKALPSLDHIPIVSITNGYDAEDFASEGECSSNELFTVVHAGALHTESGIRQEERDFQYKLLGRIAGGVRLLPRSHYYLVKALEKWIADEPAIKERIRVEFVGGATQDDIRVVNSSTANACTEFAGYLSHAESVRRVRRADLLFLPMHKVAPGQRSSIVPGKAYEYMASGRPILAAVPEGDCRDFLQLAGAAHICEPDDVDGILRGLKQSFHSWQSGQPHPAVDREFTGRFERVALTAELARCLYCIYGGAFGDHNEERSVGQSNERI